MRRVNTSQRKTKKPSKGMRNFLKQSFTNIKQAVESVIPKPKQWYYTHAQTRSMWLAKLAGNHKPHQGQQEKARRIRQMANRTHGYPCNYPHGPKAI